MNMELVLFYVAFVSYWIAADACAGYSLHVRRFENCDENSILKLHNFNVSLTEDCIVKPSGCIENTKEVHSATVSYKILRNMAPITGSRDACKTLGAANQEATAILNLFALPTSCPVPKGKVCNEKNKYVDITNFKHKLPLLLGDIQATVKIQTDAGNSCLQFKGTVLKKIVPKLPILG